MLKAGVFALIGIAFGYTGHETACVIFIIFAVLAALDDL